MLKSNVEIIPSERGKTWVVAETFTVSTKHGWIKVEKGFESDYYTFAPNLSDPLPAICHDWLCTHKRFEWGKPCPRRLADRILYEMILACDAGWELWLGVRIPAGVMAPLYWGGARVAAAWHWLLW